MEIIILLLLIILNGIFAMSELAVVSARKARLRQQAEEGHAGAKTALELAKKPDRFFSTVQIGITLIGTVAGAFGGATVAETLSNQFGLDESVAVAIVIGITTYLSLVIGELVPKTLALQNPERIAVLVARPMRALSTIAAPLVFILSQSTNLVVRLLGIKPSDTPSITEMEILSLIGEGIDIGVFEETEQEMVQGVFRLDEQRVRGVMTPRTEIMWLNLHDTTDEIRQKITEQPFTAYPVYEETLDNVVGIVRAKDLLRQVMSNKTPDLSTIMKKPSFVPESNPVSEVLEQIKTSESHVAIVVGEFGEVVGLISVTDIIEEIVGDLDLENPEAVQREDGSWLLDGLMSIHRLEDLFPLGLPVDESGEYDTLAGFVVMRLGHIPRVAETFDWQDIRFEVIDMDGKRVDKVLIKKHPQNTDSTLPGSA